MSIGPSFSPQEGYLTYQWVFPSTNDVSIEPQDDLLTCAFLKLPEKRVCTHEEERDLVICSFVPEYFDRTESNPYEVTAEVTAEVPSPPFSPPKQWIRDIKGCGQNEFILGSRAFTKATEEEISDIIQKIYDKVEHEPNKAFKVLSHWSYQTKIDLVNHIRHAFQDLLTVTPLIDSVKLFSKIELSEDTTAVTCTLEGQTTYGEMESIDGTDMVPFPSFYKAVGTYYMDEERVTYSIDLAIPPKTE